MQWNKLWLASTASLLALTCVANAGSADAGSKKSVMTEGRIQNPVAVVAQAGGTGVEIDANWLFWENREDGLEMVVVNNPTTVTSTPNYSVNNAVTHSVKGKWASGVRLGVQFLADAHDQIDMRLSFTSLNNKPKKHLVESESSGDVLYPSQRHPADIVVSNPTFIANKTSKYEGHAVDKAEATFDSKLKMFDFEIGRWFRPSVVKFFGIRPFFGVKWLEHKQNFNVDYDSVAVYDTTAAATTTTPLVETIKNYQRMKGVGVKFGFNTQYAIFEHDDSGLDIYADLDLSALAAHVDSSRTESVDEESAQAAFANQGVVSAKHHSAKFTSMFTTGFKWHMFMDSDKKMALAIRAGWTHFKLHNLNQFIRFVDDSAKLTFARNHGDFIYRGFDAGVELSF